MDRKDRKDIPGSEEEALSVVCVPVSECRQVVAPLSMHRIPLVSDKIQIAFGTIRAAQLAVVGMNLEVVDSSHALKELQPKKPSLQMVVLFVVVV